MQSVMASCHTILPVSYTIGAAPGLVVAVNSTQCVSCVSHQEDRTEADGDQHIHAVEAVHDDKVSRVV